MRAARFETFGGPLSVVDLDDPTCPADGVIVRVLACGVCRSDWHAWKGADPDVAAPHIPGHEFAGVIETVGPEVRRWQRGDRVTAPFILGCGTCESCLGGDATICDTQDVIGFTGPGAFAELVAISRADFNLVRLPEDLSPVSAAGLGCRVTTAFQALVDRGNLRPGEWLAVHGCGGVGLSAVAIGAAIGARVVAVDVNPDALNLAEALGAQVRLDASTGDVGTAIRDATGGGADVAVDALGITRTFHDALGGLRKRGRYVQVGMPTGAHAAPTIPLLDIVYARQVVIMGSRGLPARRFPSLFALIDAGKLDPARWVQRTIPLEGAGAALAAFDSFSQTGITVIDMTRGDDSPPTG